MGVAEPIGPHSKGGEVLDRYVELALGVFGAVHPTDEDRQALADHLGLETARWANDRYRLGLAAPSTSKDETE